MTLTEVAIKRPSLIIVVFMVLMVGGLMSYNSLKYELLPDFSQPALIITTTYPGASPLQVEQSVSLYLEEAIASTENLVSIKTQSYEGLSLIIAEFNISANMKQTEQLVQQSIENIQFRLPSDVKKSSVRRISPSDAPVIQLVASTDKLNEAAFFDLIDRNIIPQLEQINGVSQIRVIGQRARELQVNVDKKKLDFYGFSINDVVQSIQVNNLDFPVGKIKSRSTESSVRVIGKIEDIQMIKDIQLSNPNARINTPIRIGDVAEVIDAFEEQTSIIRLNQKPGIALIVYRQTGANAVNVSTSVREIMRSSQKEFGESSGLSFYVADDTSEFTLASASSVVHDLFLAIMIVSFVILMFLHSLRDSLIILVAIPASLISTFIAMYALGYTINIMTLLGMSLVIGILVDDSIVVLENIHRHLAMKKNKIQATIDGRKEIGFSALAITFVDVVVFAPITLIDSLIGDLLRQYAMVVVVSTLMSLFVSFTLTPFLASRFGKLTHLNPKNIFHLPLVFFEKGLEKLTNWYERQLQWTLNHKIISSFGVIGAFILTGYIMSLGILGQEFVNPGDRGQYRLSLEYDKNISLYQNNIKTQLVENQLLADKNVTNIFANIGGGSTSGGLSSIANITSQNKSEILVTLKDNPDRQQSTEEIMIAHTRQLQQDFKNVKIESTLAGFQGDKPIEVIFQSTSYDSLYKAVNQLRHILDVMPGIINPEQSVEEGLPELVLKLDRKKMNELDLSAFDVGSALRNAINGNTDAKFLQNNKEYDINVKFDLEDRQNSDDLKNILVKNKKGQLIPVANFTSLAQNTSPSMLERQDRLSSITIRSNLQGITSGVVSTEIEKELATIDLPKNVKWKWGGDVKNQGESFDALGQALLLSFLLIYLIMVALYDSFLYPFVVLFSIPVALIGAFIALNLAAISFSIFTMLGLIMLLGLVAKNGILIVDYTNQLKNKNVSIRAALLKASKTRLRPIIMTTLAMSLGMLPIAIATGPSAEWKNGLGVVMIGGLVSSLMLTVFLVPIVYETMEKLKSLLSRKK